MDWDQRGGPAAVTTTGGVQEMTKTASPESRIALAVAAMFAAVGFAAAVTSGDDSHWGAPTAGLADSHWGSAPASPQGGGLGVDDSHWGATPSDSHWG